MFSLDNAGTDHRRSYSRRIASLLATMSENNDYDTAEEIEELTTEYKAWCDAWQRAWEINDTRNGAFEEFIDYFGENTDDASDLDSACDAFESAYIGYMTPEEHAQNYVDDADMLRDVPDLVRFNIDYDGIARDMVMGGDIVEVNGHLFYGSW